MPDHITSLSIAINSPADAGFALLSAHREGLTTLTRRSAQFAGQLVANDSALTDSQNTWLNQLLDRAGFNVQFSGDVK